ncbi:hypothetical protein [Fictibacillus halophilus]|uniref:hypothetical protein n=1 Tax=Fictibacillus halophilus TaxID=1610490 RepID=UPI001CFA6F0B|nr:hypothetical protein [Fictibacillus halophilus]
MLKRYPGIILVIIGALIMMSTFIFFSGVEYERYVRFSGGFIFFLGTLMIPDNLVSPKKENKKA